MGANILRIIPNSKQWPSNTFLLLLPLSLGPALMTVKTGIYISLSIPFSLRCFSDILLCYVMFCFVVLRGRERDRESDEI